LWINEAGIAFTKTEGKSKPDAKQKDNAKLFTFATIFSWYVCSNTFGRLSFSILT